MYALTKNNIRSLPWSKVVTKFPRQSMVVGAVATLLVGVTFPMILEEAEEDSVFRGWIVARAGWFRSGGFSLIA